MKSFHRNSRLQMRCTTKEAENIIRIADTMNRTVSDVIRDAITIALSQADNPRTWDRRLATAIVKLATMSPWVSS